MPRNKANQRKVELGADAWLRQARASNAGQYRVIVIEASLRILGKASLGLVRRDLVECSEPWEMMRFRYVLYRAQWYCLGGNKQNDSPIYARVLLE